MSATIPATAGRSVLGLLVGAALALAACSNDAIVPHGPAAQGYTTPIPITNLRGLVIDQLSGAPVAGAVLEADGKSTTSLGDGTYNLQNLQQAAVQLVTTREGYDTARTILPLTGRDQQFTVRMRALPSAMAR